MDQIRGERRSQKRYSISLEVRWRLVHRNKTLNSGQGRTVDLSTGGILLETGCKLPVGLKVRLSIAWPVLLHNTSPLQLSVTGRVVRSDQTRAGIQIEQKEFRTLGGWAERQGARPNGPKGPNGGTLTSW